MGNRMMVVGLCGVLGLLLLTGCAAFKKGPTDEELVMQQAREVFLLVDSRKIGKVSFTRAGQVEGVRVLITDKLADRKFLSGLRKRGIEVVRA